MADTASIDTLPNACDAAQPTSTEVDLFANFDSMRPVQTTSTPSCPQPSRRVTRALSRDASPVKKFKVGAGEAGKTVILENMQDAEQLDNSETRRMMISERVLEEGQIESDGTDGEEEKREDIKEMKSDFQKMLAMQQELLTSVNKSREENNELRYRLEKSESIQLQTIQRLTDLKGMVMQTQILGPGPSTSLLQREIQNSSLAMEWVQIRPHDRF